MSEPADTATSPALPDDNRELVTELKAQLPGRIRELLITPEIQQLLGQIRPELIADRVLEQADELLRITNPQISALRAAQVEVTAHMLTQREADPALGAGYLQVGLAGWLGLAYPAAVWRAWPPVSTAVGGFFAVMVAVLLGTGVLVVGHVLFRAGTRRLTGKPSSDGAVLVFGLGVGTGYLLLLWRLAGPASDHLNGLVNVLLWLVTGIVALLVVVVALGMPWDSAPGRLGRRAALLHLVSAAALATPWPLAGEIPEGQLAQLSAGLSIVLTLLGALVVANPLILVPAWLSLDPNRVGSRPWQREHDRLLAAMTGAHQAFLGHLDNAVLAAVRGAVNEVREPPFSTTLAVLDHSGLGQMWAGDRMVRTRAFHRVQELTRMVTGGAVGMAGPRGAGKSTLLEAFRAGQFNRPGYEHVAVVESVPVRYDPREFALHLFARTCDEVIRFTGRRIARPESGGPGLRHRVRRYAPMVLLVLAWAAVGWIGKLVLDGYHLDVRQWLRTLWLPLVTVGATATGVLVEARRSRRREPEPLRWDTVGGSLELLRQFAREQLDRIEFQQKHTSGWSGKLGFGGVEAGRSGSREQAQQPLSYPGVVRAYGDFLRATVGCLRRHRNVATPAVVVILDELDKILSAERAQEFVNEIKALFTLDVPGFLFLVSVSEDALASFERRGLPVRDAFDSAFDLIIRVEYLSLADTRAVLGARVVGLAEPFVCLCHCVAGGLPRELIRFARTIAASEGELAEVAEAVVGADLAGKVAALRTVLARRADDDAAATELARWVDRHARPEVATLLAAVSHPPVSAGRGEDRAELLRLQREVLGYLYYCATVLEVFGPGFSERALGIGRDRDGDESFDTLASVRQLFPVNARLAWETVTDFRAAWNLSTVEAP